MKSAQVLAYVSLLFSMAVFSGCGAKTVSVTGKVTFDGKTGENISVVFQPQTEDTVVAYSAMGMTDAGGNYKLRLNNEKKTSGAMPGEYAVFFKWVDPNADPNPERKGYKPNPCPYSIPPKAMAGRVTFVVPEKGPCVANFDFTEEDFKVKVEVDE